VSNFQGVPEVINLWEVPERVRGGPEDAQGRFVDVLIDAPTPYEGDFQSLCGPPDPRACPQNLFLVSKSKPNIYPNTMSEHIFASPFSRPGEICTIQRDPKWTPKISDNQFLTGFLGMRFFHETKRECKKSQFKHQSV